MIGSVEAFLLNFVVSDTKGFDRMNKFLRIGFLSMGMVLAASALSSSAFAGAGPPPTPTHHTSVPEIDPGSLAGAMTLLTGGVLTLMDRRRSK